MDRPKPEIYIDGTRLTNVESFSFLPDIDKSKVSEKLNFGEMKFSASLELDGEAGDFLDGLWKLMQRKAALDRSYAISLALMRGYGLAEVQDAYETFYYICPRIPYRNIYVMPVTAWEVRSDLSWGARRIEM